MHRKDGIRTARQFSEQLLVIFLHIFSMELLRYEPGLLFENVICPRRVVGTRYIYIYHVEVFWQSILTLRHISYIVSKVYSIPFPFIKFVVNPFDLLHLLFRHDIFQGDITVTMERLVVLFGDNVVVVSVQAEMPLARPPAEAATHARAASYPKSINNHVCGCNLRENRRQRDTVATLGKGIL